MRLLIAAIVLSVGSVSPSTVVFADGQSNAMVQQRLLSADETAKMLPSSVYFAGRSAAVQARNSGGIEWPDRHYTLASMVDNSGYATGIREKYQAYLITETAIAINKDKQLAPGAYGFGFLPDGGFVVMDIGGTEIFSGKSARDDKMQRPRPLQFTDGGDGVSYRLYDGRDYVTITPTGRTTPPVTSSENPTK